MNASLILTILTVVSVVGYAVYLSRRGTRRQS